MSNEALSWAFESSPYSRTIWLIHVIIAGEVDESSDNHVWLDEKQIMVDARCSIQTVRRAIAHLIKDGYLEVIDCHQETKRLNKEYRFLMPSTRDEQFEPLEKYAALTEDDIAGLIIDVNLARIWLAVTPTDIESAERALMGARHVLDLAGLSTVASITKRDPPPDVWSEFRSVLRIVNRLVAERMPEKLSQGEELVSPVELKTENTQGAFNVNNKEGK